MSQENTTNNKHENNTVEQRITVSCNKCNQIYNKEQFDSCPICACAKHTELETPTDESTPFDSLQGYKVIPIETKKQREVYLQYLCLNKECAKSFWSDTDTKWCAWCKSRLIEATGQKKEYD